MNSSILFSKATKPWWGLTILIFIVLLATFVVLSDVIYNLTDRHYTCYQNGVVIFDKTLTRNDSWLGYWRDKETGKIITVPDNFAACTYTLEEFSK